MYFISAGPSSLFIPINTHSPLPMLLITSPSTEKLHVGFNCRHMRPHIIQVTSYQSHKLQVSLTLVPQCIRNFFLSLRRYKFMQIHKYVCSKYVQFASSFTWNRSFWYSLYYSLHVGTCL